MFAIINKIFPLAIKNIVILIKRVYELIREITDFLLC